MDISFRRAREWFLGLAFLLTAAGAPGSGRASSAAPGPAFEPFVLQPDDRVLVLAPHPDDEVIGCAGIIQRSRAMGLPVRVVFLTYGDNNQWSFAVYRKHPVLEPEAVRQMGMIRHGEAVNAARAMGLEPDQLVFLGYPDFGTLHIWAEHWNREPAFESMLTRVRAVPYPNAYRPGAPYKGEEILADLTAVIRDFNPTRIFLSHPADQNCDHRSLYLFTRVALWNLEDELRPALHPYLVHFRRWPMPRGYRPEAAARPPRALAEAVPWRRFALTDGEAGTKLDAIHRHRTQFGYAAKYLLSFVRAGELFGDLPAARLGPGAELKTDEEIDGKEEEALPDQLTDEEQASFVGIEWRAVRREAGALALTVRLSRPLARTVGLSLYVFGYRKDQPFAGLPKLHVRFGALRHEILDQSAQLPPDSVTVERTGKTITVRVPLALLGDPGLVMTSARTYLGDVPLDWISWRVLDLRGRP
ncbi:MAG: PIG-L family deacetylase [Kiritimatiellae bacterium]|nr:PIG-L family deacetylase [Kiritimatiellia bacterium]